MREARPFMAGFIGIAVVVVIILIVASGSTYVIQPGTRGVLITLGSADPQPIPEGMHFKWPLVSRVERINIKQQSFSFPAPCYSSDMQTVTAQLTILVTYPPQNVVTLYTMYPGDYVTGMVMPRAQEAMKEVTATMTAENIVKEREKVKTAALEGLRRKMGELVSIDDLVVVNVDLSPELEKAIEAKMVAAQETLKAKYVQEKATVDAATALIQAEGEANAMKKRAEALVANPALIPWEIIKKWDGHAPRVIVGAKGGTSILLPLEPDDTK